MKSKLSAIVIILALALIANIGNLPGIPDTVRIPVPEVKVGPTEPAPSAYPTTQPESNTVTRVIDGDTVELEDGQKVRYIGIDAPEKQNPIECFSGESTQANTNVVLNKKVRLEKDKTDRDRYGRLLRYVYVQPESSGAAEIFVNEYLVRQGFAYSKAYKPDVRLQSVLDNAQREASAATRGLWNACQ